MAEASAPGRRPRSERKRCCGWRRLFCCCFSFWRRRSGSRNCHQDSASTPLLQGGDSQTASTSEAAGAQPTEAPWARRFFSRPSELGFLARITSRPPSRILLLTGPADSGKTAILRRFYDRRRLSQQPVFYLSFRERCMGSGEAFARGFQEILLRWADMKLELAKGPPCAPDSAPKAKGSLGSAGGLQQQQQQMDPSLKLLGQLAETLRRSVFNEVGAIFSIFLQFLRGYARAAAPVLILDDAQVLRHWPLHSQGSQSQVLLDRLVLLTKDEQGCHVILATSDDLFHVWLQDRIGFSRFTAEVVGDLPEGDARAFFFECCMTPSLAVADREAVWGRVYAICGGRPLLLKHCAEGIETYQLDLEEALLAIIIPAIEAIQAALRGSQMATRPNCSPPAWTPSQLKELVKALVASPSRCIRLSVAEAIVVSSLPRDHPPDAVIASLLEYQILHLRRYSFLDHSVSAFSTGLGMRENELVQEGVHGGEMEEDPEEMMLEPVVMAPSPAMFYAMRNLCMTWDWGAQASSSSNHC